MKLYYDGLTGDGEQEVITLGRSAFLGSQRFGAAVWSGDIRSTFEMLRASICAGLNMAISGIPWWTTDIGGFSGGDIGSDYFRELIVRWFQYGVFCPIFRLHGVRIEEGTARGEVDNEVWSFGEVAYAIIKEYMFLREQLRPYIMEQMKVASEDGLAPMRPLFVDFPDDTKAWEVEDQFMFGPDILVAPVYERGATSRDVYLPEGVCWREAWSGEESDGGQTLTADAPLERIPVYIRADKRVELAVDRWRL